MGIRMATKVEKEKIRFRELKSLMTITRKFDVKKIIDLIYPDIL